MSITAVIYNYAVTLILILTGIYEYVLKALAESFSESFLHDIAFRLNIFTQYPAANVISSVPYISPRTLIKFFYTE